MKLPFAIAAAVAGALGGSALAAVPAEPAATSAQRPDVTFEGVQLWVYRGSQLRTVGSARAVAYDRTAAVGRASQADADFLDARGEARPVHVTAGSAEGHVVGRTLDAREGVRAVREDGVATTAAAHYDGLSHLASGTEPVRVHSSQYDVSGQGGFQLDTVSRQLELDGPVVAHGEVRP